MLNNIQKFMSFSKFNKSSQDEKKASGTVAKSWFSVFFKGKPK